MLQMEVSRGSKVHKDTRRILQKVFFDKFQKPKQQNILKISVFFKVKCSLWNLQVSIGWGISATQTGACPDIVLVKCEKQQDSTSANEECF